MTTFSMERLDDILGKGAVITLGSDSRTFLRQETDDMQLVIRPYRNSDRSACYGGVLRRTLIASDDDYEWFKGVVGHASTRVKETLDLSEKMYLSFISSENQEKLQQKGSDYLLYLKQSLKRNSDYLSSTGLRGGIASQALAYAAAWAGSTALFYHGAGNSVIGAGTLAILPSVALYLIDVFYRHVIKEQEEGPFWGGGLTALPGNFLERTLRAPREFAQVRSGVAFQNLVGLIEAYESEKSLEAKQKAMPAVERAGLRMTSEMKRHDHLEGFKITMYETDFETVRSFFLDLLEHAPGASPGRKEPINEKQASPPVPTASVWDIPVHQPGSRGVGGNVWDDAGKPSSG